MNVQFNCIGFLDRRTADLHRAHDVIEERRFRLKVAANHKERDRVSRELQFPVPMLLRRQAG